MTIVVEADVVADFGRYLGAEAGASLPAIEAFARTEGMSDDGFGDAPSLLAPLGNFVNGEAAEWVGAAFSEMQRKLCQLGDLVISAAERYGHVEEDNRSLVVRNGLNGDDRETITYGDGYGGGTAENPYPEYAMGSSSSPFRLAELSLSPPARPTADFLGETGVSGVGGTALLLLDTIWAEFADDLGLPGGDGVGFVDTVLQPLIGNPDSIRANGVAWQSVADSVGAVASAMGTNATTLLNVHFQGMAADALKAFLDQHWRDGAAWAAEEIGSFIAAGFDKVAEVCVFLAGLAVRAISAIIDRAIRLAARAVPVAGQVVAVGEYLADAACSIGSFLGVIDCDVETIHQSIMKIVDLARQIFGIYDSIRSIVETIQGYLDTIQELREFIANIPDLGDLTTAAASAAGANSGDRVDVFTAALDEAGADLVEVDEVAGEVDPTEFEYEPLPPLPEPEPDPEVATGTTTTSTPPPAPESPAVPAPTPAPAVAAVPPAAPPTGTTSTTTTTTTVPAPPPAAPTPAPVGSQATSTE